VRRGGRRRPLAGGRPSAPPRRRRAACGRLRDRDRRAADARRGTVRWRCRARAGRLHGGGRRLRRGTIADARLGVRPARTGARATASAVWNVAFDSGTAVGAVLIGALTATSLG